MFTYELAIVVHPPVLLVQHHGNHWHRQPGGETGWHEQFQPDGALCISINRLAGGDHGSRSPWRHRPLRLAAHGLDNETNPVGLHSPWAGQLLDRVQLVKTGAGHVKPGSRGYPAAVEPMFCHGAAGFVDADADRAVGNLHVRDPFDDNLGTRAHLAKRGNQERQRGDETESCCSGI